MRARTEWMQECRIMCLAVLGCREEGVIEGVEWVCLFLDRCLGQSCRWVLIGGNCIEDSRGSSTER